MKPFPDNYDSFLRSLKERIRTAQIRAALAVNQELVLLYWQIGREILERQEQEGWGAKVIGKLAKDLKAEFPEMKGFSARNLNFDFLSLGKEAQERDLERALIAHMRDFLLELGVGFSFVDSQYVLEVAEQEFRIDLLFYHLKLRCFIVINLKMSKFEPAYSGQINFYVNAVDDLLRHCDDQPTIGMVLCKSKENTIVEYSLRGVTIPIGVSTHSLKQLPEQLQESLPTVAQLQQELNEAAAEIESRSKPIDPSAKEE